MLDIVSLSFRVTALKYLFKRPFSGLDVQPWMAKNATRRPITIKILFRIVPPSSIVPILLWPDDNFFPGQKSSPFVAPSEAYFPGRSFVLHYVARQLGIGV
jgi:hypothetical protein